MTDAGVAPAVAPVLPVLPLGAITGIWFGFNGTNLTLVGPGAAGCVNGTPGSIFGQFGYCNAPAFFAAAGPLVAVPALGVGLDGQPCPTTRDFTVVDQDQSDNVETVYQIINGQTAQVGAAAAGQVLVNGSDNRLLTAFIDPALGCKPFTAPDLTNNGAPVSSLALNELSATLQAAPAALVPLSDPMVKVNNHRNAVKTNLYRAGVNQPPLPAGQSPKVYCRDLKTLAPTRLALDAQFTLVAPTPDAAVGANLHAFLVQRLKMSLVNLGCVKPDTYKGRGGKQERNDNNQHGQRDGHY